jgi:hypothetical protein
MTWVPPPAGTGLPSARNSVERETGDDGMKPEPEAVVEPPWVREVGVTDRVAAGTVIGTMAVKLPRAEVTVTGKLPVAALDGTRTVAWKPPLELAVVVSVAPPWGRTEMVSLGAKPPAAATVKEDQG